MGAACPKRDSPLPASPLLPEAELLLPLHDGAGMVLGRAWKGAQRGCACQGRGLEGTGKGTAEVPGPPRSLWTPPPRSPVSVHLCPAPWDDHRPGAQRASSSETCRPLCPFPQWQAHWEQGPRLPSLRLTQGQ